MLPSPYLQPLHHFQHPQGCHPWCPLLPKPQLEFPGPYFLVVPSVGDLFYPQVQIMPTTMVTQCSSMLHYYTSKLTCFEILFSIIIFTFFIKLVILFFIKKMVIKRLFYAEIYPRIVMILEYRSMSLSKADLHPHV